MIEKVSAIVSQYTNIPVEHLQKSSLIGAGAVKNSILLHRMYAAISKEGISVPDYQQIKTFGELLEKISGKTEAVPVVYVDKTEATVSISNEANEIPVGIDIEEITQMPAATDFREDDFYKMNFSVQEIAYCILQPNPYASFTGLFAAKEALVKADNKYKSIPFNQISISHSPAGKPIFPGFNISISHTDQLAVAVIVKTVQPVPASLSLPETSKSQTQPFLLFSLLALVISLITLVLYLFK